MTGRTDAPPAWSDNPARVIGESRVLSKDGCQCSTGQGKTSCVTTTWVDHPKHGVRGVMQPCNGSRGDAEGDASRADESPIDAANRRAYAARAKAGRAGAPVGALTKDTRAVTKDGSMFRGNVGDGGTYTDEFGTLRRRR